MPQSINQSIHYPFVQGLFGIYGLGHQRKIGGGGGGGSDKFCIHENSKMWLVWCLCFHGLTEQKPPPPP